MTTIESISSWVLFIFKSNHRNMNWIHINYFANIMQWWRVYRSVQWLKRSFFCPGIWVELTLSKNTHTGSLWAWWLHLPSQQVWENEHAHFLSLNFLSSYLPSSASMLYTAEKLPNWSLCSALCHHMTQIQRLRSITRPQLSSDLESKLCAAAACYTSTFHSA